MQGNAVFPDEVNLLRGSLAELRDSALRRILLLAVGACYVGVLWTFWPTNNSAVRTPVFGLSAGLLALTLVFYLLRKKRLEMACVLVLITALVSIDAVAVIFQAPEVAHLLSLPVFFAGLLLGQQAITVFAALALLFTLALSYFGIPGPALVFPLAVQGIVMLAVLISTRNLYTALAWALNGYESAFRNQNIARDRKAELEQALKSLEIATHSLYRTNHALSAARAQADDARRLKQHFAQTISHELRTPLNLIVGFSETMIQSPEYYGNTLPPLYMRDLTIVHRNACHLQALVNDVLDLARIESAQMGLQMADVDLAALVDEAVNTARALIEARGLAFHVHVSPELTRTWVDPVRVKQIIFNLLNNAARFTDRGSETLKVSQQDDEVVFSVIDTGVGIALEHLEHIFEPFRQLDDPMRRRSGGAGLGLTISQQLAHLHGGQVRVESCVGKGSTFALHLPLNDPTSRSQPDGPLDMPRYSPSPQRAKDNVALLVSRSPSASAMVSRTLRMCRTINVSSLKQVEQVARQMLPQAIILDTSDVDLAHLDLQGLGERWGLSDTSIIACPLPGEELIRRRLAAHSFLIKPISHEVLWDTLRPFGQEVNDILIVDDDPDFVRLVERMLDNPLKRYRVTSAYSGREALGLIEWRTPDLVLLDLDMPDIDGFEVTRRIQADPKCKALRIVIVSGQEEWDASNMLHGTFQVARASGLTPGETLQWLQAVVIKGN